MVDSLERESGQYGNWVAVINCLPNLCSFVGFCYIKSKYDWRREDILNRPLPLVSLITKDQTYIPSSFYLKFTFFILVFPSQPSYQYTSPPPPPLPPTCWHLYHFSYL